MFFKELLYLTIIAVINIQLYYAIKNIYWRLIKCFIYTYNTLYCTFLETYIPKRLLKIYYSFRNKINANHPNKYIFR